MIVFVGLGFRGLGFWWFIQHWFLRSMPGPGSGMGPEEKGKVLSVYREYIRGLSGYLPTGKKVDLSFI